MVTVLSVVHTCPDTIDIEPRVMGQKLTFPSDTVDYVQVDNRFQRYLLSKENEQRKKYNGYP